MAYIASNARLGLVDLSTVTNTIGTPFSAGSQLPSVTLEPQLGETCTGWDPNLGGGEFMYAKVAATVVASQTISSITISGTTATLTTGSGHGLVPGQAITITGAVPSTYNGTWQLITAAASAMTFTIPASVPTPTINATTVGTYVAGIGAGMSCELAYSLASGYLTITVTPWTGTTITGKPLCVSLNNIMPGFYGWFQIQGAAIAVTNGTITVGNPVFWQANGTLSNTIVASKQMVNATAASLISSTIGQGNAAVLLPTYQALVFLDRPFAQGAIT